MIIDALKDKYSLPVLLKRLELSKSSYYYQEAARKRDDKYKEIRSKVQALFMRIASAMDTVGSTGS